MKSILTTLAFIGISVLSINTAIAAEKPTRESPKPATKAVPQSDSATGSTLLIDQPVVHQFVSLHLSQYGNMLAVMPEKLTKPTAVETFFTGLAGKWTIKTHAKSLDGTVSITLCREQHGLLSPSLISVQNIPLAILPDVNGSENFATLTYENGTLTMLPAGSKDKFEVVGTATIKKITANLKKGVTADIAVIGTK